MHSGCMVPMQNDYLFPALAAYKKLESRFSAHIVSFSKDDTAKQTYALHESK